MASPPPSAPATRIPTPRAQLARVVAAACAATVLGAGPAVAWDLTTQPPRAEAPTPWPRPSPWLAAGKQIKSAAGGVARVYLPADRPTASAPEPSVASASAPAPVTVPTFAPPPRVAHVRPTLVPMPPTYVE
jgi:hypothetical protein